MCDNFWGGRRKGGVDVEVFKESRRPRRGCGRRAELATRPSCAKMQALTESVKSVPFKEEEEAETERGERNRRRRAAGKKAVVGLNLLPEAGK